MNAMNELDHSLSSSLLLSFVAVLVVPSELQTAASQRSLNVSLAWHTDSAVSRTVALDGHSCTD